MINKRQYEHGSLGELADPNLFQSPVVVDNYDSSELKEHLKRMLLIRFAEEKIADEIVAGNIVCPCHLAIGQEAIAVGVAKALRSTDRSFGTHRSHSHFLAMDSNVHSLFAEVLGKATGCSHGMGGSMHLQSRDNGFIGSVPIVAGTISMAVGAGIDAMLQQKKDMDVGVCFFGDGAIEEGSAHESMNLASVLKAPVLFVCENNFFSSHLHILHRQPDNNVSRYAKSHLLNTEVVDGNNLVEVYEATQRLLEKARNGEGAGFLEVITYRWRGHVGPREDNDVGLQRNEDLAVWKKRDPVQRLVTSMVEKDYLTDSEYETLKSEVVAEVNEAWNKAVKDPYPDTKRLTELVYSDGVSR